MYSELPLVILKLLYSLYIITIYDVFILFFSPSTLHKAIFTLHTSSQIIPYSFGLLHTGSHAKKHLNCWTGVV